MIDFPASPTTGQIFTAAGASWRYDGTKWVAYGSGSGNAGRNLIHNPLYAVQQRGLGAWTTNTAYTADRWRLDLNADTVTINVQSVTDGGRAAIGDEAARFLLSNVFTGNAAAGSWNRLTHEIEDVYRLANKTITLSFWAVASATQKLGINLIQRFGTGGSPSAAVTVLATGNAIQLSTTWTRYSTTIAMPSVAGKTLGTNNDHRTSLLIYYSAEAANGAVAGNIGVQSGTIQLWGVQLEIGSAATPLEKPDPADDLSRCQRFYQTGQIYTALYGVAGFGVPLTVGLPVTMRSAMTVALTSNASTNLASYVAGAMGLSAVYVQGNVVATGAYVYNTNFTASADL